MKDVAASIVGWILVAIVVWVLFGWFIGAFFWIFRMLLLLAVVGGLVLLYLKLKSP